MTRRLTLAIIVLVLASPLLAQSSECQMRTWTWTEWLTLGPAELLALDETPVTIIPNPPAGHGTMPYMLIVYKPAGVAYAAIAADDDLVVELPSPTPAAAFRVESAGFLDQTTAQYRVVRPAAGILNNTYIELGLRARLLGPITTGDTGISIRVLYIDVNAAP